MLETQPPAHPVVARWAESRREKKKITVVSAGITKWQNSCGKKKYFKVKAQSKTWGVDLKGKKNAREGRGLEKKQVLIIRKKKKKHKKNPLEKSEKARFD